MKTIIIIITAIVLCVPSYAQILELKKISKKAAMKVALAEVPGGKIKSAELEKEEGKLVWSFDIKAGKQLKEVWVDAYSGKAIKTEVESPAKEKSERHEGKKEKKIN